MYSNFGEVLNDLFALNQSIENIRQKLVIGGISYSSQDARQLALEIMQIDIAVCGNWITSMMNLKRITQNNFGVIWEEKYKEFIGSGLNVSQAEDVMLNYLRNTLAIKVHFTIENLFKNILKELGVTYRQGFWNISNTILQKLGYSIKGRKKRILTVLANMRNSYHANGIHNNDSFRVVIDKTVFNFRKGKAVECASWWHLILILRVNISVIESIIFSKKVNQIKSEIKDDFATLQI